MDPIQPVTTPTPAPAPMPVSTEPTAKKSSLGTLVGMLIIVAALVLGAWYALGQKMPIDTKASDVSSLEDQGTSTDPSAIESDLSAQSSDDFDKGVDNAFSDLDASFDSK